MVCLLPPGAVVEYCGRHALGMTRNGVNDVVERVRWRQKVEELEENCWAAS